MDTVTLIANLALTLSFVIGLIFGIVQVKAAARDRKERLTLETLRTYQSPEFAELIMNVSIYNFPQTLVGWRKLPHSEQVMFLQFTQQMESLGILVADQFININLVDKTLGSFVTTSWEKLKPLITDMRKQQPDPFLSEYFQWLAERLRARMEANPRKPFYETSK